MSLDRQAVHGRIFTDALNVLNDGTPGLSATTREVIARNIAIRATHHLADLIEEDERPDFSLRSACEGE